MLPVTRVNLKPEGCRNLTPQISLPQLVAKGRFWSVYKAIWKPGPQDPHPIAVKILHLHGDPNSNVEKKLEKYLNREMRVWSRLK